MTVPNEVQQVQLAALRAGFELSCSDEVGKLLRALAASTQGPILELGTGIGVGTAWIATATNQRITTVEQDQNTASLARDALEDFGNVEIVVGTFVDVRDRGPFGFVFIDVAEQKDVGQPVIDRLRPGGIIVLDDFTPNHPGPDSRRDFWLNHDELHSVELMLTPDAAAIIATKRVL